MRMEVVVRGLLANEDESITIKVQEAGDIIGKAAPGVIAGSRL